jgi:N-methylhydantoinase A
VAKPLGLTAIEAADGILRIAATAMSFAVKGVSTERGLDAAAFTLIAYGGAGPLHASAIAREIGMDKVIIPRAPGHFCAFGMLFSDLRYDFVRTGFMSLAEAPFEQIEKSYRSMEEQGRAALAGSGWSGSHISIQHAADMRYVGQEHPVTIDLSGDLVEKRDRAGIKKRFDSVHHLRYGTSAPAEPAEIVSLRATVTGLMKKPPLEVVRQGGRVPLTAAHRGTRVAYFGGRSIKTPTFARTELRAGNQIEGPALIEEYASTTGVMPGDRLRVDDFGNLEVQIGRRDS